MNNKNLDSRTLITIICVSILSIISFVLLFGYIIRSIDPNHSIEGYTIAISFLGIFSTFGGAYLGAKISGDNARKLAKEESMISDLIRTNEYNYEVLENFNNSKLRNDLDFFKHTKRINEYLDVSNLYSKVIDMNQEIKGILENDKMNYVFPLINLNFNELKCELRKLQSCLSESIEYCFEELDKIIKSYGYNEFEIIQYEGKCLFLEDSGDLKVYINIKNEKDICLKVNEVRELKVHNISEIKEMIYEFVIFWDNFKFKSNKDIRKYIDNYYREF